MYCVTPGGLCFEGYTMSWSRREMMLASLGLLLGGCTQRHGASMSRPGAQWPDPVHRPTAQPTQDRPVVVRDTPVNNSSINGIDVIPRSRWARSGPITKRVNPMNGVNRITVHHEGFDTIWFTDVSSTAQHLEKVRKSHVGFRGWGDIGYHYIIDRSGRVWEGRDVRYQGAHVSKNNEHNVGIMLLGNFDNQKPTDQQVQALKVTLRHLMAQYRVPTHRVYTHQELMPTACPGRNLQPRVAALRTGGYLA